MVCITHISNALGTMNDVEFIIEHAHNQQPHGSVRAGADAG